MMTYLVQQMCTWSGCVWTAFSRVVDRHVNIVSRDIMDQSVAVRVMS
jgi:hypothetical protein